MRLYFKKIRDNSDATSNYKITWDEMEITVEDFCNAVLSHSVQQSEWGKIHISEFRDRLYATICKYNRSIMEFQNDYFYYKNKKVISVLANGGWGEMNYCLVVM